MLELEHPGMHTTDTIDYEVVLSGKVWLELEDGNRSNGPCVLAVVLIRARQAKS